MQNWNNTSTTCSQNLPRTFTKLSTTWNKKAGARDFDEEIFGNMTRKQEPVYHVAALMTSMIKVNTGGRYDIIDAFKATNNSQVRYVDGSIWIYNMRQSDSLPKSQGDMEKLYSFVRHIIDRWFSVNDRAYLNEHIHIAVCFFVWCFTSQGFYFKDTEIRQGRYGKSRVWKTIILDKMPAPPPLASKTPKQAKFETTDVLLPKQQKEQATIKKAIEDLVNEALGRNVEIDWDDHIVIHMNISKALHQSSKLPTSKTKKLTKLYGEYQKLTEKISKTIKKKQLVEKAKSKVVASAAEEAPAAEEAEEGPLISDTTDDVPDSWEDL